MKSYRVLPTGKSVRNLRFAFLWRSISSRMTLDGRVSCGPRLLRYAAHSLWLLHALNPLFTTSPGRLVESSAFPLELRSTMPQQSMNTRFIVDIRLLYHVTGCAWLMKPVPLCFRVRDAALDKPKRPALQYFGGKWRIADWVIAHFPPHHCYVEPFGGAASVLLKKPKSKIEVYNDIDDNVVNLFRVLRDPEQSARLKHVVELTPYARREYELCRMMTGDPVEVARQFIVRSFQSIAKKDPTMNNGWRASLSKDTKDVCLSWSTWPQQIALFTERLKQVQIESKTWKEVLEMYDSKDTLFYLDPPYPMATRVGGKGYANELTDNDHEEICSALNQIQGMCVLSSYPNSIYQDGLPEWSVEVKKAIAQSNTPRTEAIYLCPKTQAALREISLRE